MNWYQTNRADKSAALVADRHYTRQSIGSRQFVPPGRCLVLRTRDYGALWVTSWPIAKYVKHDWRGPWICSLFRNESREILSSQLINEAVAATRWYWPTVPDEGFVTFVNPSCVRQKRDAGRCYRRAGWNHVGYTKSGLLAFQLLADAMPPAMRPAVLQLSLLEQCR